MAKKEQSKERMRRMRERNKSVTDVTDSVTNPLESVTEGVTQYPAIIHALADIEKRAKLRAICLSLGERHLLPEVRYGVKGPTMDIVSEYLTALT